MRGGHIVGTKRVDATTFKAAGAFDDPDVFAHVARVQICVELLAPEGEQAVEAIDAAIRAATAPAVVPAIDEAKSLIVPVPIAARVYGCIHGSLHLVKVANLDKQRWIVDATNVGVR